MELLFIRKLSVVSQFVETGKLVVLIKILQFFFNLFGPYLIKQFEVESYHTKLLNWKPLNGSLNKRSMFTDNAGILLSFEFFYIFIY